MNKPLFRVAPLALVLCAGLVFAAPALAQHDKAEPRKVVKTADDLPRHTYKIEGKPSEFFLSDAPFKAFVAKVKADTLDDLAKYDIQDKTTLQGYYGTLQVIAMLEGRESDALSYIEKMRDLEAKESKKLTIGLTLQSYVAAKKAAGADQAKFTELFKSELASRVTPLPWDKVREVITQAKGRAEIASRAMIVGSLQAGLDPVAEQNKGELSSDIAQGLIAARMTVEVMLPVSPSVVEVYSKIIASHETTKADVWTPRLVTLNAADKATPVVVAIWDSGVDVSCFGSQVWTNPKETVNGKDDDNNGFVDDVHGIAFDLRSSHTPDLLHPISEMHSDSALITSHMKGMMDLQANIDSPEASAIKKYITSLKSDQVGNFVEDMGLFGNYSHGTHVAGIASEGNPFARLLPVRITFDFKQIPQVTPSVEQATKEAKAAAECITYMRKAGVRVCNMSWGGSKKDIEETLEKKNVGKNPEERAELARTLFNIQRDALDQAMRSAPEILFVAAAGNSDNDNTFSELIPSGLSLPNMITIGAVDQTGKPTGFTTFGKNVTLYANGFEVESYIPGGKRMKFSGTSMAAPNTTNLAAKLIALNPNLSTAQVIELITKGAEPMEGYEGRLVINPKKSIGMLNAKSGK